MKSLKKQFFPVLFTIILFGQGCLMEKPLASQNSISPDKVIAKTPEEVMFSQEELETLGVEINPQIAVLKPQISQELGTSARVRPGKEARYSIKSAQRKEQVFINITQFIGIQNLNGEDATLQATKAEFDKTLSEGQQDWEQKLPPLVGNEQFTWGQSAIIFRRNNFIVLVSLSNTGMPTAEQAKEVQTYAVMIDNKIQ